MSYNLVKCAKIIPLCSLRYLCFYFHFGNMVSNWIVGSKINIPKRSHQIKWYNIENIFLNKKCFLICSHKFPPSLCLSNRKRKISLHIVVHRQNMNITPKVTSTGMTRKKGSSWNNIVTVGYSNHDMCAFDKKGKYLISRSTVRFFLLF